MRIESMYMSELEEQLAGLGGKPYRARQLFAWLHRRTAVSYDEMTDLPKELRRLLAERFPLTEVRAVQKLRSELDGTEKYLFALEDDNVIESVRMAYEHGISVCVSSQAGCRMGCRFCASTLGGLVRSLTAAEMLRQVYAIQREGGERVSHAVIMGSGEPLENYEEAVRFIRLLSAPEGLAVSQRNITLSTCGIVPQIRRLAGEKLAVTLAISLHAPNDRKRRELMPVAVRYPLGELMDACRYYFQETGRRLTFEYALVKGQNDSPADAQELAELLRGMNCHVNLIPVNPVEERNYARPASAAVMNFHKKLEKNGINVTMRREMGADIHGACGQLRKRYLTTVQENTI